MALPVNLTTITVTGTYLDIAGDPIAGQVKFTPRAVLRNITSDVIIINSTITVTLDVNGSFSQVLVATDDVDAVPVDFTYRVEEAFVGGRTFDMLLPSDTPGATIDIADVSPAVADDGTGALYVSVDQYNTLEARITVVEGLEADAQAVLDSIDSALTSAISYSNTAVALVDTYVDALGAIMDGRPAISPLLFPAKSV